MKIPHILWHELISKGDIKKKDYTFVVKINNVFIQFLTLKRVRQHYDANQHSCMSCNELDRRFLEFCSFSCSESLFNKIAKRYPKLKNIVLHKSYNKYLGKKNFIKFSKSSLIITTLLRFLNEIIEDCIEFKRTSAFITEVIGFIR